MPHFFRVLENEKNKKYSIISLEWQPFQNMPHLPNIKLAFSYKLFVLQLPGK
jgi:hypothetical protein